VFKRNFVGALFLVAAVVTVFNVLWGVFVFVVAYVFNLLMASPEE